MSVASNLAYSSLSLASWRFASNSFAFFRSSSYFSISSFICFLRSRSATFCRCIELSTIIEGRPRRSTFAGGFFSTKLLFLPLMKFSTKAAKVALLSLSTLPRIRTFIIVDFSHYVWNDRRKTLDLIMVWEAGSGLRSSHSSMT